MDVKLMVHRLAAVSRITKILHEFVRLKILRREIPYLKIDKFSVLMESGESILETDRRSGA